MVTLTTGAAYIYSYLNNTPVYETSTRMILSSEDENMNTLMVMIKDPIIMEQVRSDLNLEQSAEGIANQIEVNRLEDSEVIQISVTANDPGVAAAIANKTAEVYKNEIVNILDFEQVQLLSKAEINPYPINEFQDRNLVIAGVFGVIAGIGLIFLLDTLDGAVKTREEVEDFLGIPVIGFVPPMNRKNSTTKKKKNQAHEVEVRGSPLILSKNKKSKLITHFYPESIISEQFRTIRTNIQFLTENRNQHLFLVTSPGKKEGKSTAAANLAVTMAQQKQKVLLIDTNLRNPMMHQLFKVSNTEGLTEILTGRLPFEETVYPTGIGNLDLLTSGQLTSNPSELLGGELMENLLKKVSHKYDVVLVDAPPVLHSNESLLLSHLCEGVVLVLRRKKTDLRKIVEAKKVLDLVNADVVGAIMNERR